MIKGLATGVLERRDADMSQHWRLQGVILVGHVLVGGQPLACLGGPALRLLHEYRSSTRSENGR
jgi:hypothetical protein